MVKFKKILVANRGEIAIRVLRAANELGLRTVAIYAKEDKLSLHRFKSDEAYQVGAGLGPIEAYLCIEDIIRIAKVAGVDAIHPGYGFLSERPDFADACAKAGITFIGPDPDIMRKLGDKVSARTLAITAGVPVVPATNELPDNISKISELADGVGYPLILKASWGGGGRGMRIIKTPDELESQVRSGRSEAKAAFGRDEMYLERYVENARHVEVQILADSYGNIVHLYERDCSVQRRHQKIIECAPAPYLNDMQRQEVCQCALRLMQYVGYQNAGTVEFLMDVDSSEFFFIEVNPRVQVEHTITEEVTGIDIVKAQIRIAQGAKIGDMKSSGVPEQSNIRLNGNAIQCRITSEDPGKGFIPDYGRITAYRGATGFGIRLDGGPAYSGAIITRHYDSLLEKITAWAPSPEEAINRMDRALREFRIRGISTNIPFLENLINHPKFRNDEYTTQFIDKAPELFEFPRRRDRATRLLRYIADVSVNGHPQTKDRARPDITVQTPLPLDLGQKDSLAGTKNMLDTHGAKHVSDWLLAQKQVLITDTTMRDAHQSLLATRMRSYDILGTAETYSEHLPMLFSLECWGGATFDVAMRFLNEDPWARLRNIRERVPNIMLQMLLRGSNAVGYKNYPDNVVQTFIHKSAEVGIDVFRVFDSLNWVENMRVAIDAVLETGKICEASICYTGDILDPKRTTYTLDYFLNMGRELKAAGAHIIAVKDMAGLLKPDAATLLIEGLKSETGLPVHFHTHDTSGIASATVMSAIAAGVDVVDLAMDSFSGLTSQPNLGSIVSALESNPRSPKLDRQVVRKISDHWGQVREQYVAFESNLRAGASEVYQHEMPGGQFTNLKEQARSLGLAPRWPEIAKTYADVNMMFGDIPKVTPSSKVVGDLALAIMSADINIEDVTDPDKAFAFPQSVVSFFKGELGQPPNGFPKALQKKVLRGEQPLTKRPGLTLAPVNMAVEKVTLEKKIKRGVNDEDLISSLLYPTVFLEYTAFRKQYGPVNLLPTLIYYYGMAIGQEVTIDLEVGKTLNIILLAVGETDDEAMVKVFFELNGQPRSIKVPNRSSTSLKKQRLKAEEDNPNQVAAPMPAIVSSLVVKQGQKIAKGDLLLNIEAMKMETAVFSETDGVISQILVKLGDTVEAKDLLVVIE